MLKGIGKERRLGERERERECVCVYVNEANCEVRLATVILPKSGNNVV